MWIKVAELSLCELNLPIHKVAAQYVYTWGLYTIFVYGCTHIKMTNTFSVAFKFMCTWNKLEQLILK